MTLVEPKEAPVEKPAKTEFDPQAFLAKVGAGKTILNIKKNQHVFKQGDVADTVFYIQKGPGQAHGPIRAGQGSGRRNFRTGPVLRRGLPQWPYIAHRDHDGDGRMCNHFNYQRSDDRRPSFRAEIFRAVHGVSVDTEQPG